jgi:hypothetical protein
MDDLGGVTHVSIFPPLTHRNGGPDPAHLYRIRAQSVLGEVDLQPMKFVGIAPFTGAARFASP